MGACESKDSSTLVIDETILRDIETKIKKRLQNQVNDSNKAVAQKQNITIREKRTGDSRYYNDKTVNYYLYLRGGLGVTTMWCFFECICFNRNNILS